MDKCHICQRTLNVPEEPDTLDCGGDCLSCMATAGDPDCADAMAALARAKLLAFKELIEFTATPLTQVCCNRPGLDCCGDPNPVFPDLNDTVEYAQARCNELEQEVKSYEG